MGPGTLVQARSTTIPRRAWRRVIVLDTSVAVAFMNRRHDGHERVVAWMETLGEDLFTTPLIVAEIDHLVSRYG